MQIENTQYLNGIFKKPRAERLYSRHVKEKMAKAEETRVDQIDTPDGDLSDEPEVEVQTSDKQASETLENESTSSTT